MVRNPKVPRIYGAPKTHKSGKKLRPITSNTDAPSEKFAKTLAYQFKQVFMLKHTRCDQKTTRHPN
jgi:hypothetical protein